MIIKTNATKQVEWNISKTTFDRMSGLLVLFYRQRSCIVKSSTKASGSEREEVNGSRTVDLKRLAPSKTCE